MSDFPENTPDLDEEINEEESTVFSAPQPHKKTAPNKKKRLLPVVLAAFLAVAILAGGTFAVTKLIPEKKKKSTSAPKAKTVSVLEEEIGNLKTVSVKNKNGTFQLYAQTEGSGADKTVTWYAKGYKKDETNTEALSQIAEKSAKIDALEKQVDMTLKECGLDPAEATVSVEKNDGAKYSFSVGIDSPDGSGTYVKIGEKDTVYIATTLTKDDFVFDETTVLQSEEPESQVDLPEIPAKYKNEDGSVSTFDKLSLSGAKYDETLVLKPNTDSTISQFAAFVVTEPTERMADKVDELLVIYSQGITYSDMYSDSASQEQLKKYRLDEPDLKVEAVFGDKTVVHRFKKQDDGNYAVYREGENRILSVAADSISFVENGSTHYYAKWLFMQSINDLSAMTVKSKEESYTFSIKYNGEEADETYVIKYGGKKIKAEYFQDYYQECLLIPSAEYTTQTVKGDPDYTITLEYSDSSRSPMTVEFWKLSETRYQYSVNKKPMGKVASTKLGALMSGAAKVAKNKSIK